MKFSKTLLISFVSFLFLFSCTENGTEPSQIGETNFFGLDLLKKPSLNKMTGMYHYTLKFGGGVGLREGRYNQGPKIQIEHEKKMRELRSTSDNSFILDFETIPRNVRILGWGYYYRDSNGFIHWKVHENKEWQLVKMRFKDSHNKNYAKNNSLAISFRENGIEATPQKVIPVIIARIKTEKKTYNVDEIFTLDGSKSNSEYSAIEKWIWNIDDGICKEGIKITHSFKNAGPHRVTLTVTDKNNNSHTMAITIQVNKVIYPYNVNEFGIEDGKGIGDSHIGFRFNHQERKIKIYMNFNEIKGKRGREYVFGSFNGQGKEWKFFSADVLNEQLKFNLDYHDGWGYGTLNFTFPENLEFIELSFGYSGWYDVITNNDKIIGYNWTGDFSHMDPKNNNSIYLEKYSPDGTYDYHVLIYSSGKVIPWKN